MSRRPLLALLAAVAVVAAGCAGEDPGRTLPDVDPPAAVSPPPADGTDVDRAWLRETSRASGVPARVLEAYARASLVIEEAQPGCDLGWSTLAAIGRVESVHGAVNGARVDDDGVAAPGIRGIPLDGSPGVRAIPDSDGGELDDDVEWDRAVGPMQFIPATWERWGSDGDGDGRADPDDVDDAALAAGRYLCAAGDGALGEDDGWLRAVLTYNNSAAYAAKVSAQATRYAEEAPD